MQGRQTPFSHLEIMLALLSPNIFATSFCLRPLAFLYFLRLLGMLLVFLINRLVNSGYVPLMKKASAWV